MFLIKYYILLLIISFCVSFVATALVKKMAVKKHFFDKPTSRKVHTKPVPTMGGIALWLGFNAGMVSAFLLFPGLRYEFLRPFAGISIAAFIIVLTGIYDDRHDLNANIKLLIQILAAIILIAFGFEINLISKPFGGSFMLGALSIVLTVFWTLGIINAVNLIDGLDGLAAGVSGISVFFLFIAAVQMNISSVSFLSICLVGALLGFLPHNFYPAKIFMGNAGSMFLGIMLALISIAGFQKRTTVFTLVVPLLAMAVPIIDTFLSIMRRILKKQPIFKADKEHIHHQLLIEEKSQPRVVLTLYFLTFCFGLIALGFSKLKGGYALLVLILIVLVTFKWIKDSRFLEFKK